MSSLLGLFSGVLYLLCSLLLIQCTRPINEGGVPTSPSSFNKYRPEIMVKLETFLLETDVGETIIVCVAIDTNASTYFPVELHLMITLQFLATVTTDSNGFSAERKQLVVLPHQKQCLEFEREQHRNPWETEPDIFMVTMLGLPYPVTPSSSLLAISEILHVQLSAMPPYVEVSEGQTAVVCISADFNGSIARLDQLSVKLVVKDISTFAGDYSTEAIPASILLSAEDESQCLHIPIFINDDAPQISDREVFQIALVPGGLKVQVTIFEQCAGRVPYLSKRDDVSPGCIVGHVLPLIGGASSSEGLVNVCTGTQYLPIDLETFTIREANVICRQMGLGSAGFPLSANEDLGLDLTVYLEDIRRIVAIVECTGDEEKLSECVISKTIGLSEHCAVSAVSCIESTHCSDSDIRLVPPPSLHASLPRVREGRLEVCFQGVWGAVYDADWSALDAAVTCKQLGFSDSGALPIVPAIYPDDSRPLPIAYDSPACDSTEYISLLACPRAPLLCVAKPSDFVPDSGSAGGSGDGDLMGVLGTLTSGGRVGAGALVGVVGVRCEEYESCGCEDFDVRLSYRERTESAGNLEICFGNLWNSACSDLFDEADLLVACRMLGFTDFERGIPQPRFLPTAASSEGPYYEQNLECYGFERTFNECRIERATARQEQYNSCMDVRIQCLARPRVFFTPVAPSGRVFVELNRMASLKCVVDVAASYPPVTNLQVVPGTHESKNASITPNTCMSAGVYKTNNAMLRDSGLYNCIATSGGLASSHVIELVVEGFNVSRASTVEYLRFSKPARLVHPFIDQLVLNSISTNIPGLHQVQCQLVTRRVEDKEAELDRFECIIFHFGPSFPSSVAAVARAVLQRLFPFISFTAISDSGFCDFSQTEYQGNIYTWSESKGGDLLFLPCPSSSVGQHAVSRLCSSSGGWTSPCESAFCTINQMLNSMLVSEEEYEDQVEVVANALQVTVTDLSQQSSKLLNVVANFFDGVVNITRSTNLVLPTQVIGGLVDSLSSLQQWSAGVLANSPSTSRIVMSFEDTASRFSQQQELTKINFTIPNQIFFAAENTAAGFLQRTGRAFAVGNNTFTSMEAQLLPLESDQDASISLSPSFFANVANETANLGIYFALYVTPSLFPLRDPDAVEQGVELTNQSTVVASSVLACTVATGALFTNITPPIEINLRLTVLDDRDFLIPGSETCVYWDFTAAGGRGNWSSDGCTIVATSGDVVKCWCTHLTNFAILVDICTRVDGCERNPPVLEQILSFVTYIGVSLSMLGMAITFFTMLAFKKVRQRESSKYHVQLCVAIFCMLLVFIAGIEQTSVYGVCVTVSILIHYFTLASVLWMTAEAVLMFHKLIFVFRKITTTYIVMVSCICWGVPLVLIVIPLIIDLAQGNQPSSDLIIKRDAFCFLSNSVVFWLSFLAPVFALLLMNFVLCIVVVVVLIKHTKSTMSRRQQAINRTTTLRLVASIVSIMFLFGLSWLFAALTLTVQELRTIGQILFTVSTSFQGIFIFVFFCILSVEARESWKEFLSCGRYKSEVLHPSGSFEGHRVYSARSSSTLRFGAGRPLGAFDSCRKGTFHSTPMDVTSAQKYGLALKTVVQQELPSTTTVLETASQEELPSTTTVDSTSQPSTTVLDTPSSITALEISFQEELLSMTTALKSAPQKIIGTARNMKEVGQGDEEEGGTAVEEEVMGGTAVEEEVVGGTAVEEEVTGGTLVMQGGTAKASEKQRPIDARVTCYSTLRAQHQVEEYQVDFYDISDDEDI